MGGNFKVRITNVNGFYDMYTLGKIYEIKNGSMKFDDGFVGAGYKDFEDLCGSLSPDFELIEEEGENEMEDLRELIKPCYVVVHVDDTLSKVEINRHNEKIISGDTHWCNLHSLSKELLGYCGDSKATIKEIYGYSKYNNLAYKLSIEGRPLIWKRGETPVKSLTQLEIESIELEQRKLADRLAKLKENA